MKGGKMEKEKLRKEILKQLATASIYNGKKGSEKTHLTKPIMFIMDGEGVKRVEKNKIGIFIEETNEVPILEKMEVGFEMALPRIPVEILLQIVSFFEAVYEKHQSEAIVQVFWNEETKKYFMYIPEQSVSGASCDYERNTDLERKHLLVFTIHSHAGMGAFFSGTDDKDEMESKLFGVMGKIDTELEVKFRTKGDVPLKWVDIFYKPECQEEWLSPVKKKVITPVSYEWDKGYGYGNWRYKNWGKSQGAIPFGQKPMPNPEPNTEKTDVVSDDMQTMVEYLATFSNKEIKFIIKKAKQMRENSFAEYDE